jgi:transcriptional regulator with XRE-family HTH domain
MRLTCGELWWLYRRRSKKTQPEISRQLGVTVDRLGDWERDRAREDVPLPPSLGGRPLSHGEVAALLRRRAGIELRDAARRFGISRQTYIKAEADRTSTAYPLRLWWEARDVPAPSAPTPVRMPVARR